MSDLQPPDHYSAEHRAVWNQLRSEALAVGVIARINPDTLDALVVHTIALRQASAIVAKTHSMIERDGRAEPNPTLDVMRREKAAILKLRKQLRLGTIPRQGEADPKVTGKWCDQHN